jgi:hypothetical protein
MPKTTEACFVTRRGTLPRVQGTPLQGLLQSSAYAKPDHFQHTKLEHDSCMFEVIAVVWYGWI